MSIEISAATAEIVAADDRAGIWFGALWRAERLTLDACHVNLLAWIMALPAGLDPAAAASAVIAYQQRHEGEALSAPLMALLHNVARYPMDRLARMRPTRRQWATAH